MAADYDDMLARMQEAQRARVTMDVVGDVNPDEEARAQELAQRYGAPVDLVRADRQQWERQAQADDVDEFLSGRAAALRASMADPEFAAVSMDDVGALASLEIGVRNLGEVAKFIVSAPDAKNTLASTIEGGLAGASAGILGTARAGMEVVAPWLGFLPVNPAQVAGDWLGSEAAIQRRIQSESIQPTGSDIADGAMAGVQSLVQFGTVAPVGLLPGGQAAVLPVMSGMAGGQAYQQAREAGLDAPQALVFGIGQGGIELVTNTIPVASLFADLGAGAGFGRMLLNQLKSDLPREQLATALQDLNEWAALHPERSLGDYLRERPSAALQTAVATVVGSAGNTALIRGLDRVMNDQAQRDERAQYAQQMAAMVEAMHKDAQATKLAQRSPVAFEQFLAQATQDGPTETVYLNAEALRQAGLVDVLTAASVTAAAQMPAALASGGDIAIPTAEYAAKVASQPQADGLVEFVRFDPYQMSRDDAKKWLASKDSAALREEVDRAAKVVDADQALSAQVAGIKAQLAGHLKEAGRTPSHQVDAYSTLASQFYAVQSARMGVSPQELWQAYPLRVVGDAAIGGEGFAQGVGAIDDATGLPINDDGTVTVYHHTSAENADRIRADGRLVSAGEPDLYFTTQKETVTGYGDTAIAVRVRPERLILDDEFTDGRRDFRVPSANRQRMVRFLGDDSAVLLQEGDKRVTRGAFDPTTNTIALLEKANPSTFLHELGHSFLQMHMDMTGKLAAGQRAGESMSDAQAEMLRDADELLRWFGGGSLDEWLGLDVDGQRAGHEQFARGFEAYLMSGKSPSVQMHGIFQRFRAWLVGVYKQLKELNVDLTPEVRGVMDRMIASSDQIAVAAQARSLMPMFENPQETGMDAKAFSDYHALALDADQSAIDQLQAAGMRDLQWARGAHGRETQKLRARSAQVRREMRVQARNEVLSRPVYRAWQFLTGKISEDDKPNVAPRPKATKDVDPAHDSLLKAIAKLGGIARESARTDAGVHPDDFKASSEVFGKPVFRKTGGMRADDMAQALAEWGYLERDENGQVSLHALEDAIAAELRGQRQYSMAHDFSAEDSGAWLPSNPEGLLAARLDAISVRADWGADVLQALDERGMVADTGLHPDVVADLFGFDSGDELLQAIQASVPPQEAVEARTDALLLEQHGELATPQAIAREADRAIHSKLRTKMLAAEQDALAKALGQRAQTGTRADGKPITTPVLPQAAAMYAEEAIGKLRVRDVKPARYVAAAARAGEAAKKALREGDIATALAEKRNQIIQHELARVALDAVKFAESTVTYARKLEKRPKSISHEFNDQIQALLARFDLRSGASLKAIDNLQSLRDFLDAMGDVGAVPDIAPELVDAAKRTHWKNLTVSELGDLRDTLATLAHMGRENNKLLTAQRRVTHETAIDAMVSGIAAHAGKKIHDDRTATTPQGMAGQALSRFSKSHVKASMWARIMDGGEDGGPVWEYFIRSANKAGDAEVAMRAKACEDLTAIMAPFLSGSAHVRREIPGIGRSLTRQEAFVVALNTGNAGNLQRLMDGEHWTQQQVQMVLGTLTSAEADAVQGVWDYFESEFKPKIAAKEKRLYGVEPKWVEPQPVAFTTSDGVARQLRGGYYPAHYDPKASRRGAQFKDAEDARLQLKGAFTSTTTRRGFTKDRAAQVKDRPLLLSLEPLYGGVQDVIHDLAFHEWAIDMTRLLNDDKLDTAIRKHHGDDVVREIRSWVNDVVGGESGGQAFLERGIRWARKNVSTAAMALNVMSAAIQPLGLTQSVVRVGAPWVGVGVREFTTRGPGLTQEIFAKSPMMQARVRTRFRELNEIRNTVRGQTKAGQLYSRYGFWMMLRAQQLVDVPTWQGAYMKALAEGRDEQMARDMADQAVLDAQGGGQVKDLSGIERGHEMVKLFTVFYSFFNTTLNLGVQVTMNADTPAKKAKLAADYLLLFVVPAILGQMLRDALTAGDATDEDDWEGLAKRLAASQLDYLMGLFVGVRELSAAAKKAVGLPGWSSYDGPAGLRALSDITRLGVQVGQGEVDEGLGKAILSTTGTVFGLPSAQIAKFVDGVQAIEAGETANPMALLTGHQEPAR